MKCSQLSSSFSTYYVILARELTIKNHWWHENLGALLTIQNGLCMSILSESYIITAISLGNFILLTSFASYFIIYD